MFYIIETDEQLQKFSKYSLEKSFVHAITNNDLYHSVLSSVVAYYVKPVKSRLGFILPVNHNQSFNISEDKVIKLLSEKVTDPYVYDKKQANYLLPFLNNPKCIKLAKYLKDGKVLDIQTYNTPIHNHIYSKYKNEPYVNKAVPLSKLCEKFDNFISDNSKLMSSGGYSTQHYEYYSNIADVLFEIESKGVPINTELLKRYFTLDDEQYSIHDEIFYTDYNLYTNTGRPSNAFNGVNFGALPKADESRSFITPKNNMLVEFDYKSYHPNILSNIIGYHFDDEDIHMHLGKMYFKTDVLTEQQYADSKGMTFKQLYTSAQDTHNLEFFTKVRDYKDKLWDTYRAKGYIESSISKKPIRGLESKTQILPYLLQSYETEMNAYIMAKIIDYLSNKSTNLVLYSYDAFLIDYDKSDGVQVLDDLKSIIEMQGYKTSMSYGRDYSKMEKL